MHFCFKDEMSSNKGDEMWGCRSLFCSSRSGQLLNFFMLAFGIKDQQCKTVSFLQIHNQGLCQLVLMVLGPLQVRGKVKGRP